MNESINKILKMVEEGKIDADKATELIEAINTKEKEETSEIKPRGEKMLKIKVIAANEGEKVNVKFPIKFIKASLKAFGKMPINIDGDKDNNIDVQAIAEAIENDIDGKILECCTEKGDNVEIVIE
jgi:polyhydroxyalkanoate synthesis regulator phasin